MPRTLAIGDIHGCDTALTTLLDGVAPQATDTVVVLGDVVDRGPGTKACIDRLLALRDECRLVAIMGNHEEMMLNAIRGIDPNFWLRFGGVETLESYGGNFDDVPSSHLDFIASMVPYHETEGELFVHANWDEGYSRAKQPATSLRWEHLSGREPAWPLGKRAICGHTSQKDGLPKTLDGWVCIDTFAHGMQWLTCLDVETDTLWRANEVSQFEGPLALDDIAVPFTRRR